MNADEIGFFRPPYFAGMIPELTDDKSSYDDSHRWTWLSTSSFDWVWKSLFGSITSAWISTSSESSESKFMTSFCMSTSTGLNFVVSRS